MTDPRERASMLLAEWLMCKDARPKRNAVDIQIDKDLCQTWAQHLAKQFHWGTDSEITEACDQLESRLQPLKEKIVIEVLKNGSV